MNDFFIFFIYSVIFFSIMLFSEFLYKKLHIEDEWSRKFAHFTSGLIALSYPVFIDNHWIVLALTISYILTLFISKKLGFFKSIFNVRRPTYGDLLFVFSSWWLFFTYQNTQFRIFFFLPFSIVVFSDTFAALFGKYFPLKKLYFFGCQKSIGGSFVFFMTTLIINFYFLEGFLQIENCHLYVLLSTMILTLVEALSVRGWDNFTVPVVSALLIYIMY